MSDYRKLLETARDRLNDMLRGDDGQAWKEAQRFVDGLDAAMRECDKQAEPVAAESRFDSEKTWGRCTIEHHYLVQSEPHKWPGYQTRLLYTHPVPAVAQEPVGEVRQQVSQSSTFVQWYRKPKVGDKLYTEAPAVAVNEQDRLDAARYRWLFGARTEDECKHWNVGNLPLKPQDRVIGQVATVFMPKVAVDAEIDAAIAAELRKGGL